jgi:hypothetical protein
MLQSVTKSPQEINPFFCEKCQYKTCNKKDFTKHLSTKKHEKMENVTEKSPKIPTSKSYVCPLCNKEYKSRMGLWHHKNKCKSNLSGDCKNMIMTLINENKELKQTIFDMIPKIQPVINNTNSNNTNNFNISVFLNEHCKDAINFSDFIDNIRVSHEDLQNNAQLGFVGGISKIITDNLKQLTLHERPIHCTDAKRETMYIKDQDSWQKDKSIIQEKLNRAIQEVSRKSVVSLMKWKQSNPDYADLDSDFSTLCLTMQQQSIAGMNREKFYPKVIHRIAESVPCKP